MASVETVAGAVDSSSLGVTLVHEHLRIRREAVPMQFPHVYHESDALRKIVTEVQKARALGVRTICDPTVMGIGRDVRLVLEVAERTGMQFVVASGAYTFDYLPPFFADRPIDELADAFVHDIEHGIQGTSIKAGFLKCVTDRAGVTPDVEKALRATARAHRRTGVPIMTHTDARLEIGLRQQEIFADEGVDLHHVLIGHSGDSDDLAYLQRLAKRGSFLGMDRYGMEDRLSTDIRNQTVAALCELGFGDHLLLSQDTVIDSERVYPADLLRQRRNRKLTYLMEQVLVDLQARVTPYRVRDSMLIDNVRRWLEPVPPY